MDISAISKTPDLLPHVPQIIAGKACFTPNAVSVARTGGAPVPAAMKMLNDKAPPQPAYTKSGYQPTATLIGQQVNKLA